jgi:threonyl-tRNA synthetase
MTEAGIRAETDSRNETLQAKIRDAQIEKVPYMIVVGKNEAESKKLSVRKRDGEEMRDVETDDFIKTVGDKIANKTLDL